MKIAWKLSALDAGVASVRHRALFPLIALREHKISARVVGPGSSHDLSGVDVLVIVKGFTADDLQLAQTAAALRIPVIYDLCDNIFAPGYGDQSASQPVAIVRQIARWAAAFVTPTDALAEQVRAHLDTDVAVHVVPDGIETEPLVRETTRIIQAARRERTPGALIRGLHLPRRARRVLELARTATPSGIARRLISLAYRRLESFRAQVLRRPSRIAPPESRAHAPFGATPSTTPQTGPAGKSTGPSAQRPPGAAASNTVRRLLWFGIHGGPHGGRFGLTDLADQRLALEAIARDFEVELVVISNHFQKYLHLIAPISIQSRYVEWSSTAVQLELDRAAIVLVPNSLDEFSRCKSANRTVMALSADRPVVATRTPALQPLEDCIETDDFEAGIRRYLSDPQHTAAHLETARLRCQALYGPRAIADAWLQVLRAIREPVRTRPIAEPVLIVVAHLVQDLELILPIVEVARQRGVASEIWASRSMIRRWPYTLERLSQAGVPLRLIEEPGEETSPLQFPPSVRAVLTVADTNLGPHRFARRITLAANRAGIRTGTLQHGFENVGLTYSDSLHLIERIDFAAHLIFVWGDLSRLHPRIPPATRRKCIAVGCPKRVMNAPIDWPAVVPADAPVIGLYENLHWHRYDEAYRRFFVDGARRIAAEFGAITFIIKPHNAGRWLTTGFSDSFDQPNNLLVADPSTPQWEGMTAAGMLPKLSAVITSPSTVALDAARFGLPVAVVAHDIDLTHYAPLHRIERIEDWGEFVRGLTDPERRQTLVELSHRFASAVLVPGDAAAGIVDHLLSTQSREHVQAA
ncbi:MAG: hypothetical protein RL322_949 [Pseudomonadota bacterium]|jgi:glycosyltransferase involved in cell wall biosynthesis